MAGMITATDVTEQHSTSAVYLAGDIYKQTTLEAWCRAARVRRCSSTWPQPVPAPTAPGTSSRPSPTRSPGCCTWPKRSSGPAPVDYVWVAAGSQARSEQTAKSDQDNCLVLDDRYDEARHGDYFKRCPPSSATGSTPAATSTAPAR
jgi:CBS domain-containing protein